MKRILFLALITLIPIFLLSRNTNNYLSYRYLSTDRYEVNLHIFRDCRGISLPTSYNINVSSGGSCFSSITMTLSRDTIIDKSVKCPTSNVCQPPNSNSAGLGIEEIVYTGIMDLDSAQFNSIKTSNCCEIYFEFRGQVRPNSITTLASGSIGFNYAFLERCLGNNHSVKYKNKHPNSMYCNNTFEYNPMAIDADGDSLVFSLESPLTNRTSTVTYNTPLSTSIPLTPVCPTQTVTCAPSLFAGIYVGFGFDSVTNNMRFTPASCSQVGVFVNTTKEYRKDTNGVYQLIGITRKEHLLLGANINSNIPPTLDIKEEYYACVGDTFRLNVNSTDKAPTGGFSDTTFLTWEHNINNMDISMVDSSAKNQSATVKWAPSSSEISNQPYLINFGVSETNCSSNAQASRATAIYVVDSLSIQPQLIDRKNGTLYLNAQVSGGSDLLQNQFSWEVSDNPSLTNSISRIREIDSITRLEPGKYYVTLVVDNGSNCAKFFQDSIDIAPYFRFNFNNVQSEYCKSNLTEIEPNILNANRPISYEWYLQGSPTVISRDSILRRVIDNDEDYLLVAKDSDSASYSLNFSATILPLPDLSTVRNPTPKCLEAGQFDLFLDFPIGANVSKNTKDSNFITFAAVDSRRSNMVKTGLGTPYWYYAQRFYDSSQNQNFIPNPPVDSVRVYATNFWNGCTDSAQFEVRVNQNPVIQLIDKSLCQNVGGIKPSDYLLLTPSDLSNGEYTWSIDSAPAGLSSTDINQILKDTDPSPFVKNYVFYPFIPGSSPTAPFNANRIGTYKLKFCFTENIGNCQSCGFVYLTVLESPELIIKPFERICYDDGILELDSNSNISGGVWSLISFNDSTNGSAFDNAKGRLVNPKLDLSNSSLEGGNYFVLYENATQTCPVRDSINISVGAQPNLKLNTYIDTLYLGESLLLEVVEGKNWDLRWENGSINSSRLIREFPLSQGVHEFIMTATNPATSCQHIDTVQIMVYKTVGIKSAFASSLKVYPNPSNELINVRAGVPLTQISLYQVSGQLLKSFDTKDQLTHQLTLSEISSGTYYLAIKGEGEEVYIKINVIK